MRIESPHPGLMSPARPAARSALDRADFASILGIADRVADGPAPTGAESARAVAEEFVARVFIEPVLAEVRNSNTLPPPFGPGPGEKQFAGLIDAKRAMDMVRSVDWPIVDRLTRDLTRGADGA